LEAWFNIEDFSIKFICHNSPEVNATFRDVEKALQFKELFPNSTCNYFSIKK